MSRTQTQAPPSKIVMLAPAALVLIAYGYLFHGPQQTELQTAQRRLKTLSDSARETSSGLADAKLSIAKAKESLRQVESDLEIATADERLLDQQRQSMRTELIQASRPASIMQQVTTILESNRLQVIDNAAEASGINKAAKLIEPIADLLDDKSSKNGVKLASKRDVYRVKVRGSFEDLKNALRSMAELSGGAIPLSLEMEALELSSTAAQSANRIWVLSIMV